MGRVDKPLIDHNGHRLIEQICATLAPACASVLISANRNIEDYERYAPTLPDQVAGRGPLAGLATVLAQATAPWAFVCPGDAPNLDIAVPKRLCLEAKPGIDVVVAHDGQRRQQLHMLVHSSCAPSIRAYLDGGGGGAPGGGGPPAAGRWHPAQSGPVPGSCWPKKIALPRFSSAV